MSHENAALIRARVHHCVMVKQGKTVQQQLRSAVAIMRFALVSPKHGKVYHIEITDLEAGIRAYQSVGGCHDC